MSVVGQTAESLRSGGPEAVVALRQMTVIQEPVNLCLEQGKMADYDSPHNIVGYAVVAVNDIIAGINDSSR